MKIRAMSLRDYNQVRHLWINTEGIGLRNLDDSFQGVEKFLDRNPATNFVAQMGNEIIGVILCGHDGRRGTIYHTSVRLDYREKGIGKALVKAAIEALRKEEISKVGLLVFASNELGNAFWESLGFVKRDDLIYRNMSIHEMN